MEDLKCPRWKDSNTDILQIYLYKYILQIYIPILEIYLILKPQANKKNPTLLSESSNFLLKK